MLFGQIPTAVNAPKIFAVFMKSSQSNNLHFKWSPVPAVSFEEGTRQNAQSKSFSCGLFALQLDRSNSPFVKVWICDTGSRACSSVFVATASRILLSSKWRSGRGARPWSTLTSSPLE